MAAINFSGLASGLDTELLIESLLVNRQRRITAISDRIDQGETQKRALNDVKTALTTFQGILENFDDEVFENRTVSSADDSIITAEANGSAALGEYEIQVNRLATRSAVAIGTAQSSATAVVGGGTLTLQNDGGGTFAVTVDPGATLTDLSTAINDQFGEDLQASIIEVSTGSFQLVVSTKATGASLNLRDDAAVTNPSSLSGFDAGFTGGGISSEQTGVDSEIVLNGITITRSGNEIDDVLTGVTLDLNKAQPGTSVNLEVGTDFDKAVEQFDELAKGYNDILNRIDGLIDRETGALPGDNDLVGLRRTIQSSITRFVPNIDQINIRDDGSVGFTSLSQLGFKTDQNTGELSVDKEKLREGLENNFDEIRSLFQGNFTSSNPNVTIAANLGTPFSGAITLDTVNDTATIDGQLYNLTREGSSLSFDDSSPFSGLVFFAPVTDDPNVTLQVSSGLGAILEGQVDQFAGFSGLISDRTATIDDRKRGLDRDLEAASNRLESERTRLTNVFARAEQAISTLQGLQASLGAQLVGLAG